MFLTSHLIRFFFEIRACPGALSNSLGSFIPSITAALTDRANNTLKIDTLEFLHATFSTHKPEVIYLIDVLINVSIFYL